MLYIKDPSSVPDEGWQYPAISGPPVKATCYQQLYGKVKQHYSVNGREVPTKEAVDLWLCQNLAVSCYDGQTAFRNKFTDPPTFAQRGLKGPDWPWMMLPLKLLAHPEDRGAGDIIARTIGPIGGDAFKKWYKTIFGKSCGCKERQEEWNYAYPL